MAKSQNQKLKIVYLLRILMEETDEKHPITMKQLIERLSECGIEAERKSLYDDMEALITFGIDIRKEKKEKSYFYYIGKRSFSTSELKLLVDAVMSARFLTEKKSAELLTKLSALTSQPEAKGLRRQVAVRGRVKSMNQQVIENIDLLHDAIAKKVQISFDYCDWNEKKELVLRKEGKKKEISPLKLLWDNENYYLVAYDKTKKKPRHYRVDKMMKLKKCEAAAEGEWVLQKNQMTEYSEQYFEMFGGEQEAVTLWVRPQLLGTMIDRFGTGITVRKSGNGYEVRIKIAVSNVFLGWLIGLGDGVKILRPQTVADRMLTLVGNTLREQNRPKVKNIIFDLGMVLVDFRYRDYCRDLGFSEETVDFFSEQIVLSDTWKLLDTGLYSEEQVINLFIGKYPEHEDAIRLFFRDYRDLVRPFPDALDWIREYKGRGYSVYVLTNYPERMFEVHLENQFPFLSETDGVFVSAKEKLVKPDVAVYRKLLERFSINAEESVFLDDSSANICGAEESGIHGILVDDRVRAKKELDDFLRAVGD